MMQHLKSTLPVFVELFVLLMDHMINPVMYYNTSGIFLGRALYPFWPLELGLNDKLVLSQQLHSTAPLYFLDLPPELFSGKIPNTVFHFTSVERFVPIMR